MKEIMLCKLFYLMTEYAIFTFMKIKFKQWWLITPLISTKRTITSQLNSVIKIETTSYEVGIADPGLWQTHKWGGDKQVKGIPTLHFLVIAGCSTKIEIHFCINKRSNKLYRFYSTQTFSVPLGHNVMLGTMMAEFVRLRYPHSILLLINPHMGITFYTPNDTRTSKKLRCRGYQRK